MWRVIKIGVLSVMIASCGGGIDTYEEGVEAQVQVMEDMIDVLRGVDDDDSAEDAAGEIEALGNRLAEISSQMAELPTPTASEMQAIAAEQMEKTQALQQDVVGQMMKIAEYPVLMEAWMSAMQNML